MFKRKMLTFAAAGLVAAGVGLAAPGVALAKPSGCTVNYLPAGDGAHAYCTGGTGEFRPRVECRIAGQPNTYFAYGPWLKPKTQESLAICQNGNPASAKTIQYR
jgi:hypothetical protein